METRTAAKLAMYFQLSALGKRMKEIDGEHLAEGLDDLSLGGTVVLDEGEDERHGGVTQDGEAHDHGNDLGVLHGVGDGDVSLAGGDEGDETVEGTDEGGEAEDLLGGGGVLAAEEVLLLEVGAEMASTQSGTGGEGDADGGEGGGGRNVTEGEEHDARDEDGGGEPLLPVVLLADDEDGESHPRMIFADLNTM